MSSFVNGIIDLVLFAATIAPIFLGVAVLYFIAMKTQRYWEEPFARLLGIELEEQEPATEEQQNPLQRYSA